MEPVKLPDIAIIKGALFQDDLEMYQDDAMQVPVDLTGKVFIGEIRKSADPTSTLLATWQLTVTDPPTGGVLHRRITAAASAAMPTGSGCYNICETSVEREVWFEGNVAVKSGPTA